uniref:Serine acetyltransferase N-terminal domain-containing protein n=1 Tax=Leersia perrieri TaxID=77586 RepID=A0A0D9VP80_9ORYZ
MTSCGCLVLEKVEDHGGDAAAAARGRVRVAQGVGGGGGGCGSCAGEWRSRSETMFPIYVMGSSRASSAAAARGIVDAAGDPIWEAVKSEAKSEAEKEPILSSFLYASVLSHDCLERALSFVLANRLEDPTLLATQLIDIFNDVMMNNKDIRRSIRLDAQAFKDRDPACAQYSWALLYLKGYHSLQSYRIAHVLWNQGRKVLALALQSRISEVFAVDIHPAARIGEGILLDHGTGLVIGETAVVGNWVSLMQGVTLGGTGKQNGDRHPKIGQGALLGAGATILGNINVGEGAMIAAGSLVLKDVPPHSMAVGNPAKVVGYTEKEDPSLTMKHASLSGLPLAKLPGLTNQRLKGHNGPSLQDRLAQISDASHDDTSAPSRHWCLVGRETEAGKEEEIEVLDMEAGTVRCAANYAPLTPISFIERAAAVYGDRDAVVFGERRHTWRETRGRCVRVAAALAARFGVARGDVVAVLSPNVPAMYELHFAVPMAGAVLCTFNTRHDAAMISALLAHSGAKVFFVDSHLLDVGRAALSRLAAANLPVLLTINDGSESADSGCVDYEDLVNDAPSQFEIRWPVNELDPITLNYTSGTTSRPKGVVYNHRGAYLNTIATVLAYDITATPTYLWTVPMFHCNGWNLPWGVAMQGGTNVCIRHFTARLIFEQIARHGVTHMGGAPTVLNMIANAPAADRKPLPAGPVRVMTGGAPPPPRVLLAVEELGFVIYHIYGLTETYGPATVCTWMPEWDALPAEERARLKARQGFHHIAVQEVAVKDSSTMESVPYDGHTVGEVMFRGNTVMSGYYKDIGATRESMAGGWLRTGDLAVRHPDGYIQLKDRAKDIIISGGENISSIEVESVIFSHPAVLEAAVVARPDDYWGETPCAFVKLKDGANATEEEIIRFCREKLPHYMAPKTVVFDDLPKTSTGKTQKFVLREKARAMGSLTKSANSCTLSDANYAPLTPVSFLERAAVVYGDRTAVVSGEREYTWRETRERCLAGASALAHLGVNRRDVVAVIAANISAMYELHFSVPMTGGVLCTLNTRHDAAMVSVLLKHSEAKVFLVESEFLPVAHDALKLLADAKAKLPLVIAISDTGGEGLEYEALLRGAPRGFEIRWPADEHDPISLNYTSGTTSRPKGVIYSHRGAYLNSMATLLCNDMTSMPVYLWTVPMFHCNGWCMVWATAAQGGTSICIRSIVPSVIFDQITRRGVTNMGGAPTVLNMIVNAPPSDRTPPLRRKVVISTGGAPPPPQVLAKMEELGFDVVHGYGLTETYGPATRCVWRPEWDALPAYERARIKARQGVQHQMLQDVDVKDPVTMASVPSDGRAVGEVMIRGNTVMSGYYKDVAATEEAMRGGWLRTGDLGVRHPDGYIQLKDRAKDIIISGGENISSIEVESVLFGHHAVLDAAVVARPDDHWGETVCAFVTPKDGEIATADEIIAFCRARLPRYMAPRTVVFGELPKTATGKTQKFLLREKANAMGSLPMPRKAKL